MVVITTSLLRKGLAVFGASKIRYLVIVIKSITDLFKINFLFLGFCFTFLKTKLLFIILLICFKLIPKVLLKRFRLTLWCSKTYLQTELKNQPRYQYVKGGGRRNGDAHSIFTLYIFKKLSPGSA